ncbi:MAG: nucleotide exchange factor GrpE [Thermoplasmata archaeon]|nr:nucleotide exchange factor GrpE [Thermoplasmata archaeon]
MSKSNITKKELMDMLENERKKNEELEKKLKEEEEKSKNYWDRILRMQADFENFQKNMEKERQNIVKMASEDIIKDLIDDLENLELALENAKKDNENIYNSLKIVYDHFLKTLEKNGLERIESIGKKFDPYLHEAIMIEETLNNDDGLVVEEFRKGYKLNGKVIKPSKVKVLKKR